MTLITNAQFNTGAKLLSGNITANIQNSSTTSNELDGLKPQKIEESNNSGLGLELGYGKIKQQNKARIFGFGYNYLQNISSSDLTDSLKNNHYKSDGITNTFYLFAERNNFVPIKNNWGFLYNIKTTLKYDRNKNGYANSTNYLKNDSLVSLFSNTISNTYSASLQLNIGAYYMFNKHFLFFTQVNLLGANISMTNVETELTKQNLTTNSFAFNLSGVLTPIYKLGDFNIGIKYIIPSKN